MGLENVDAWRTRARPTNVPAQLVGPTATSLAPTNISKVLQPPKAFGYDDYAAFIAGTPKNGRAGFPAARL